jgi:hypothetical protein
MGWKTPSGRWVTLDVAATKEKKGKDPSRLTKKELVGIVSSIQTILYLDVKDNKEIWNPDKVSGADALADIASLLDSHDLVPQHPDEKFA